jgi:hypothetical protein
LIRLTTLEILCNQDPLLLDFPKVDVTKSGKRIRHLFSEFHRTNEDPDGNQFLNVSDFLLF